MQLQEQYIQWNDQRLFFNRLTAETQHPRSVQPVQRVLAANLVQPDRHVQKAPATGTGKENCILHSGSK